MNHIRKYNEDFCVMKFDMNDNFIKEYGSVSDAARDSNVNRTDIANVTNGRRKSVGGYKWIYTHEFINKYGTNAYKKLGGEEFTKPFKDVDFKNFLTDDGLQIELDKLKKSFQLKSESMKNIKLFGQFNEDKRLWSEKHQKYISIDEKPEKNSKIETKKIRSNYIKSNPSLSDKMSNNLLNKRNRQKEEDSKEVEDLSKRLYNKLVNKKFTAYDKELKSTPAAEHYDKMDYGIRDNVSFYIKEVKLIKKDGVMLLFIYIPSESIKGRIYTKARNYNHNMEWDNNEKDIKSDNIRQEYYVLITSWIYWEIVSKVNQNIDVLGYDRPVTNMNSVEKLIK